MPSPLTVDMNFAIKYFNMKFINRARYIIFIAQ